MRSIKFMIIYLSNDNLLIIYDNFFICDNLFIKSFPWIIKIQLISLNHFQIEFLDINF